MRFYDHDEKTILISHPEQPAHRTAHTNIARENLGEKRGKLSFTFHAIISSFPWLWPFFFLGKGLKAGVKAWLTLPQWCINGRSRKAHKIFTSNPRWQNGLGGGVHIILYMRYIYHIYPCSECVRLKYQRAHSSTLFELSKLYSLSAN